MLKELFGRFCFCYDLTKGNLIFAWIQLLSSISFAVLMIVLLLGHKTIFLEVDLITFKSKFGLSYIKRLKYFIIQDIFVIFQTISEKNLIYV